LIHQSNHYSPTTGLAYKEQYAYCVTQRQHITWKRNHQNKSEQPI